MESEWNLSDKINHAWDNLHDGDCKENCSYKYGTHVFPIEDVREFIKKSKGKSILGKTLLLSTDMREEIGNDEWINVKDLDKLAGEKLV